MNTKTFLITGGAGFIGSNLVEELLKQSDARIVIIDNLSTGLMSNISQNGNIIFHHADITDSVLIKDILKLYTFDYVFHLAAIASVQESISNPQYTHKVNFDSTLFLLEYFRAHNIKRMVFASSAAVYGNKPNLPCKETDPVSPISPYGVDKYSSEQFSKIYYSLYGMKTTSFRFFNVYGPRQNPKSPYSGVISIFMEKIINGDGNINIYGDGKQTRDFVYINDLVKILINAIDNEKTVGESFNLGTGVETNLIELAEVIAKIANKKVNITHLPEREGDIKRSLASNEKLKDAGIPLKFSSIEAGIAKYVDYILSNI